ncbi:MAG: CHASE2 domain-containing protein, partial [Spirochaetales bacterium]|nr:CHASE2 domain-containing protein [Spirochaetales bacterium]
MNLKTISWYLYPLLGFILIFAFSQTRPFEFMEYRIFDQALRVLPSPEQDEKILLLEIDDHAIAEAGTYPLGRDLIADGTLFYWENGVEFAVYDSDYIDTSPRGVDERFLTETMPYEVSSAVGEVEAFGTGLVDAVLSGQIPPEAAGEYLDQYRGYSQSMEDRIIGSLDHVVLDKDAYFGRRLALFGRGIISIGMLEYEDPYVTEERRDTGKRFALTGVEEGDQAVDKAQDIRPSIIPISSKALTLGFTRVIIDDDGVRRRINPLYRWNDDYYPQLGFALITQLLQPQSYSLQKGSIALEGISGPAAGGRDRLVIPVDREGRMLINWPHASFEDSFRHLSFYKLIVHDIYVRSVMQNLEQLESWGLLPLYAGDNPLDILRYSRDYRDNALKG